jgi:hypothetical protein
MEKRHILRLTTGECFERLYPPLRAFRPIHGTKNSHDKLPSSMTMTARNQRAIPGIRSALGVPVMQGNNEGELALFRGVAKRNGTLVPIDGAAFCSR